MAYHAISLMIHSQNRTFIWYPIFSKPLLAVKYAMGNKTDAVPAHMALAI